MGDYFKPWRRRFGVVTLLMTLAFLGGWGRSHTVQDVVSFPSGSRAAEYLMSSDCCLSWQRVRDLPVERSTTPVRWFTNSLPIARFGAFNVPGLNWRWKCCGIAIGELSAEQMNGSRLSLWIVPYWFVITPLALLSAFLLLTKPHKSNQMKLNEPIPIESNENQ